MTCPLAQSKFWEVTTEEIFRHWIEQMLLLYICGTICLYKWEISWRKCVRVVHRSVQKSVCKANKLNTGPCPALVYFVSFIRSTFYTIYRIRPRHLHPHPSYIHHWEKEIWRKFRRKPETSEWLTNRYFFSFKLPYGDESQISSTLMSPLPSRILRKSTTEICRLYWKRGNGT